MTKPVLTKTWIGGLVTFAAGIVLALAGVFLMLGYGGTFTQVAGTTNSYDFVPNLTGFFWLTVSLIVAGGVVAAVGGIVQLVAWIAGLFNSHALPEKSWFLVLLLGGLVSFVFAPAGFAATLMYVIAAPDGTPYRQTQVPVTGPQAGSLAPTA